MRGLVTASSLSRQGQTGPSFLDRARDLIGNLDGSRMKTIFQKGYWALPAVAFGLGRYVNRACYLDIPLPLVSPLLPLTDESYITPNTMFALFGINGLKLLYDIRRVASGERSGLASIIIDAATMAKLVSITLAHYRRPPRHS